MRSLRRHRESVHEITGARRGLTDDVNRRQLRYGIGMAIRTVCFVMAIITHGPLRVIFFVGALVLPYIAVVYANAGREPAHPAPPAYDPDTPKELSPSRKEITGGV